MNKAFFLLLSWFIIFSGCGVMKKKGDSYVSSSENIEVSKDFLNDKTSRGIYFYASGNEPFWNLEFTFDDSIYFKDLVGLALSLPLVKEKVNDHHTRYSAESMAEIVKIDVLKQTCSDNMSGQKHNNDVHVSLTSKLSGITQKLSGCGTYLGDYRINDIWALRQINDKIVNRQEQQLGLPTIEFQIIEKKLMGFAGCNEYSGAFEIDDQRLLFSEFKITNKACDQPTLEDVFLGSMRKGHFTYRIYEGELILENKKAKLVFQKVD